MPAEVLYVKVQGINAAPDVTTVGCDILDVNMLSTGQTHNYILNYDHPGYSTIYTLLMAAAVNYKHIDLTVNSDDGTIQEVRYLFLPPAPRA
jgi:hypothetical protein